MATYFQQEVVRMVTCCFSPISTYSGLLFHRVLSTSGGWAIR